MRCRHGFIPGRCVAIGCPHYDGEGVHGTSTNRRDPFRRCDRCKLRKPKVEYCRGTQKYCPECVEELDGRGVSRT